MQVVHHSKTKTSLKPLERHSNNINHENTRTNNYIIYFIVFIFSIRHHHASSIPSLLSGSVCQILFHNNAACDRHPQQIAGITSICAYVDRQSRQISCLAGLKHSHTPSRTSKHVLAGIKYNLQLHSFIHRYSNLYYSLSLARTHIHICTLAKESGEPG